MAVIDISRSLTESTAVFPGDRPVALEWTGRQDDGEAVTISALHTSVHAGTHADAPLHFQPHGAPIDALPLSVFVGPAVVLDTPTRDAIRPLHCPPEKIQGRRRVLFRSPFSKHDGTSWSDDFPHIHPDTAHHLAEHDVVLIGTDAPSVDPADSSRLPAHHTLADCGIAILENLDLTDAKPGTYWLSAAPLKLVGRDGAPVRAVLIDTEDSQLH